MLNLPIQRRELLARRLILGWSIFSLIAGPEGRECGADSPCIPHIYLAVVRLVDHRRHLDLARWKDRRSWCKRKCLLEKPLRLQLC